MIQIEASNPLIRVKRNSRSLLCSLKNEITFKIILSKFNSNQS